jgi:UDP-N-acetyl-alpha-D-muramoyl-L-alanyl-L-glutamate epimerase
MSFQPAAIRCFRFCAYEFCETAQTVSLHYAFDDSHYFCETLHFPGALIPLNDARRAALTRIMHELHLVAGISYYKAALPPQLKIETALPSPVAAAFLENLYLHGLGEFAYRNGLNVRIHFPANAEAAQQAAPPPCLPAGTVVPVGGGKDSLVSVEILRAAGHPCRAIAVGSAPTLATVAARTGLPYLNISRRLDPLLFQLNQTGAYNGHVPISAILAYVLALAAILYGFDTIVMSNERSANVGNLYRDGIEVNHQYSKSADFEAQVQARFAALLPGLRYFSLLRAWSELEIARSFARNPRYDDVFSSCNSAYKIQQQPTARWCLDCPKCRFVFLSLAPFMPKARLLAIFSANLLDDPAQIPGFDALLGYGADKPFECVGEIEESRAAFYALAQQPDWRNDSLVVRFRDLILPTLDAPAALLEQALTPQPAPLIPPEFTAMLYAYR